MAPERLKDIFLKKDDQDDKLDEKTGEEKKQEEKSQEDTKRTAGQD